MDYVAHIVYIIMLILQTRGHSPQHNTSNNNSDNSVISSGNSTAIQSETLATTQAGQGYGDVPENNTSSALSPVMGQTTTGSSKSHLFTSVTIPNTHKPKLLNKTSIDGCENCIVGDNGTEITISCLFNGTNKPSMYLGGLEKTLKKPQDKMPGGIWKYLLPAHKTAQYHNDTIICNVTDPSTNTTLEDTARFYAKIENSPFLTVTKANGTYTVLCEAKGRPAPKVSLVHHLPETSFNVTANVTTPPSGEEKQFTSKIEYLDKCTSASSNRLVKCCDDRKLCTNTTLQPCPETTSTRLPPQIPQGHTGGVVIDDTSSASTASMITTCITNHTSLADDGETKQWLVPLTIGATIVGVIIVMVAITFLISLTQSRASKQQGPSVNVGPQLGNHAERVERYEMNANEEGGPRDTAVYANVPAEVTHAPNTQSPHTDSPALVPGADGMNPYSEARSVNWEVEKTIPGEEKELTYIGLDFSENKQTPGPSSGRYQPVEYVLMDFTQTNMLKD